ncbi:unnamed protein product [Spirodela intermedia]|uniref:Uncharacterized protein n=1 Tax=Spirodela intermedia TaxID=51605 RepID=A0A7I8JIM1_SPIIN|nr:unnamed protein product [Spirodela intermedia]CAA6669615.1 unnamed protein product [Spirodela intermedia]
MHEMDYHQSNSGCTLFFKHSRNRISILLVYVDDMILTRDDLTFLGMEIAYSRHDIFLSQLKYTLDLLKEIRTNDSKPATTPIDLDGKLGRYHKLIGKLIYLSHTRLNITYVIKLLSQFIHDPREVYTVVARRVLLYLKGTPDYDMLFQPHGHTNVKIFTNADYAGSIIDRQFTSGYYSFLGGNLITWHNKKQLVLSRSSVEFEL